MLAREIERRYPGAGGSGCRLKSRLLVLALCLVAAALLASCNRSPQAKEADFLKRGKALLEKKDYRRAVLEFMNAAKAIPNDAEPYYQLGLTSLALQDPRTAVAAFSKALELDPKHAGARLKLAELMAVTRYKNLAEDAMSRLEAIVAESPQNLEAVDALAAVEWRLGQSDSGIKLLEESLEKFPDSLKSSVMLARLKVSQGDLQGAEDALQKAAASAPQSVQPVLALGQLYTMLNKPDDAERQFRQALQRDPKSAIALLGIAAVQASTKRLEEAEHTLREVAALPDKRYEPVYGVFLYSNGKRDAALVEFQRMVKAHPADRAARTRLVWAYLQMNKLAEAQSALAEALKKNPRDVDALYQQSKLYLLQGKTNEAQADLTQAARFEPNSAVVHLTLAQTYKIQGRSRNEREELQGVLRADNNALEARLELAANLLAGNDPHQALRLLDEAPPPQKQVLQWLLQRNRVLLALRDTGELRRSLAQIPPQLRLAELVLQDALLKMTEHDFAGARKAAEEVLSKYPEDAVAAKIVVDCYIAEKQPNQARETLARRLAAHPQSAPLHNLMADWYLRAGDPASARKEWESAKAADAKFLQADLALAGLDRMEKHPEAAMQRLLSIVAADQNNVPALLQMASIEEEAGNGTAAISVYRRVLEVEGTNVTALNNLAYHLAVDDPDAGLKLAQQAGEIAPENPAVQDTLGWIYYRKGIYKSASQYLQAAFTKEPTPQRQFHLAMSYIKLGDARLGQEMLAAALQKDPNLPKSEAEWSSR